MELDKKQLVFVLGHEPEYTREFINPADVKTSPELQNRRPREVRGCNPIEEFKEHVTALAADMKQRGQRTRVILVRDEGGNLWLIDGHHRLEAVKKLRRKVKAYVIKATFAQATDLVRIGINRDVKKGLTKGEKVALAWEAFTNGTEAGAWCRQMSLRDAGELLQVSYETIKRFRRLLECIYMNEDKRIFLGDNEHTISRKRSTYEDVVLAKAAAEHGENYVMNTASEWARDYRTRGSYRDLLIKFGRSKTFTGGISEGFSDQLNEVLSTLNELRKHDINEAERDAVVKVIETEVEWWMMNKDCYPKDMALDVNGEAYDDF